MEELVDAIRAEAHFEMLQEHWAKMGFQPAEWVPDSTWRWHALQVMQIQDDIDRDIMVHILGLDVPKEKWRP